MPKTEFKNLIKVTNYLIEEGWKVSRSAVYKHGDEGKIRPERNGSYSLKTIDEYALLHLQRVSTRRKIGQEDLQKQKIMAEVAKLTEQAKMVKIKRMFEEGLYILRDDLDLEFSARAAILEAGLKYLIQSRATEWITMMGGDQTKEGDLIRDVTIALDDAINEFASMKEYHVILKSNDRRKKSKQP